MEALVFRPSLEVTENPRSKSISSQLLPWLEQIGLGPQIEPFHREILRSPQGSLSRESQTEAFWRGEAASFLGWAIQLLDKPDSTELIDPGLLVSNLKILQPTATELLSNAKLRPQNEIDDYCAYCLMVRHQFQLSAITTDGKAILGSIHEKRLAELGLTEAFHRLKGVEQDAATLASTMSSVRGLYVVRSLTAEWMLVRISSGCQPPPRK